MKLLILSCALTCAASPIQKALALTDHVIAGWKYIPKDPDFWADFQLGLAKKKYAGTVNITLDQFDEAKTVTEKNEARLALGKTLRRAGYNQAAFYILTDLAESSPSTFVGNEALIEISQMVPEGTYDEERLTEVINQSPGADGPADIQPMMGYYLVMDHLRLKEKDWIKTDLPLIKDKTYWFNRFKYYEGLSLIKDGKPDDALKLFEALAKDPANSVKLASAIDLQVARLYFAKKRYADAEKKYAEIESSDRNTGRILYERAWNQYYMHDYSLTLGILESLKAPYFTPAVEPEQYVLSSVVLRDVCHYPAVQKARENFFAVFGPVIRYIGSNQPLENNPILMSMSLVQAPLRPLADVVDAVQKERQAFKRDGFTNKRLAFIYARYDKVEKEVKGRLSRRLEAPLRQQAERVLQVADQIKLLDYVSGLDENRVQALFEQRGYAAPKAERYKFETLFWPTRSLASTANDQQKQKNIEFWWEEMKTLRVLISDRCSEMSQ